MNKNALIRYVLDENAEPKVLSVENGVTLGEWIESMRSSALPLARKALRYGNLSGHFPAVFGTVYFARRRNYLWWVLRDGDTDLGVGRLRQVTEHETGVVGYDEDLAVIFSAHHQGKGIYPDLLKKLQNILNAEIDSSLEFVNTDLIKIWKRLGAFQKETRRFRLRKNPSKLRRRRLTIPNKWPLDIDGFKAVMNRMSTEPLKL